MKTFSLAKLTSRLIAQCSILVFFITALEIIIMISPFAFFFYSVFNPVFKFIDHYPVTKWLTSFFLPHMILPPTSFLVVVRILGSILIVAGLFTFVICASQVYLGKIFKWGIVDKGLYRLIRHPQYLALVMWGFGMCILWPRFIVLASLSVMVVFYYFLAKDEERRMMARYGDSYRKYMLKTGMFFPRFIDERFWALIPSSLTRNIIAPLLAVSTLMASGFCLREITLRSIPFVTDENVTLVSILPEDNKLGKNALDNILKTQHGKQGSLLIPNKDYLAYLMPADYIMQGMIANTGSDFHLFKQHNTLTMITEWVVHPFEHLRSSPSLHMAKMHNVSPDFARRHHCPIGINDANLQCNNCPFRRVIIVEVDHATDEHLSGSGLLSFNTIRIPICYIDLNTSTGEIVNINKVEKVTAWQEIPTPAI